jgi:hypothetical protein
LRQIPVKESTAIRVTLGRSRLISAWMAGVHAATLLPLWWSAPPLWAGAAVATLIALHGAWAIRRFGLLCSPRSVTGIALHPGGRCALGARDGEEFAGHLAASTVVLGSIVVLAVKDRAGHAACRALIARDMLNEDDFRRLRVGLKWGGTQETGGSQV